MRRSLGLLTVLLVAVALLVGPAGAGPGAPQGSDRADKPASYAFLEAQVFTSPGLGQVAVGMPNARTVKVQHRAEGGTWSRPTVLFKKKDVTCGAIDGRASAGGVALILLCDKQYYEDQAPVHSQAFVTQDLVSWTHRELDGEAYQDPAISADGSRAAWLYGGHGQYLLFSQGSGFTPGHTSFEYDSGGETVVVDDAGTVTVMGPDGTGDACVLGVFDQPLVGPEDHYVVAGVDPGCTEGGVDNVDDRTVVGGWTRSQRFTVTREPGQRWELTRLAPADEPSLVRYQGPRKQVIRNIYSDAEGQALVSLGSPDRRGAYAQVYDDATGTWGSPTLVYSDRVPRCRDRGNYDFEPFPRMHAVTLSCGHRRILLTSPDSVRWTATRIDARPYALSRDRSLLAAAGPRTITIVSPTGTRRVDRNAPGRCDVVFPISAGSVLRLHGGRSARWPTKLQKSVGSMPWRTIQTVPMPATGTCQRVTFQNDTYPGMFFFRGDGHYVSLRVKRGGVGGWRMERFSY